MDWTEMILRVIVFTLAGICINRAAIKIKRRDYDDPMFAVWLISGVSFVSFYIKDSLF